MISKKMDMMVATGYSKLLLRSRIVIGVSLTASVAALLAVCVLLYFILQMTTATDVSGVVKKYLPTSVMILTEKTIGTEDSGEIVQEASSDLAVISVSKKDIPDEIYRELKPAVLGSSKETKVGQTAILIGNALGEGINVSCGIVSAVNRRQDGDEFHSEVLVSDAAVNFGNSGSMLVDKKGRVIGINTSKDSKDGSEGMGYYVLVDVAKKVVDQLLDQMPEKTDEKKSIDR